MAKKTDFWNMIAKQSKTKAKVVSNKKASPANDITYEEGVSMDVGEKPMGAKRWKLPVKKMKMGKKKK